MKSVSLAEIAKKIDYGVTASANALPVGPKFLRITDIQDDSVDWADVPFCETSKRAATNAALEKGDIVFARTGATTGKSFLIRDCPDGAVFASYLIRVRPSECVDPVYLSKFFQSRGYWAQVNLKASGAAQPGVNASKLSELEIPLPPLPEQQRIAGILDQADALRRLRRRSVSRLSDLGQAIFYEMFGDVAANPKGWPVGTIRDLLSEAKYGTAQKANTDGNGLPILRMGNLTYSGQLDLSDLKHVEMPAKDVPKYTTQRGDLLFNRTNSKDLVGKTAVVDLDDPLAIAGYLIRARTNKRGNPHYISAYLNSRHGKAVLRNMCKNIVGMANINAQELQDIVIALPPVELQNEFADRLAAIAKRREAFNSGIEQSDFLFTSLQHRAFRGEL